MVHAQKSGYSVFFPTLLDHKQSQKFFKKGFWYGAPLVGQFMYQTKLLFLRLIAAFLANIFYIFGQDVLGKDSEVSFLNNFKILERNDYLLTINLSQGNTILHMMARKGDFVAPTLDTLMSVSYRHGTTLRLFINIIYFTKSKLYNHHCENKLIDFFIFLPLLFEA